MKTKKIKKGVRTSNYTKTNQHTIASNRKHNTDKLILSSITTTMSAESFTYCVCLAIATDRDFCSRNGKVHKITDSDWRAVWITGVHSQDVVAFTHCHGTVARYVIFITRLCTNVYLNHQNVIYRQSFYTRFSQLHE